MQALLSSELPDRGQRKVNPTPQRKIVAERQDGRVDRVIRHWQERTSDGKLCIGGFGGDPLWRQETMAQQADCDVIAIGTGHSATNQRPEVSLRRRANDSGKPRQWRHGEHPEAIRYEPGQEPPRAGRATSPDRR